MTGRSQSGFILAATLWLLAIIAIGATYFAERVSKSIALARQSMQVTEVLTDFSNTRAEILFRFATTPLGLYGLGPDANSAIALDNRPYRGTGEDVVRLQDNRGLINVNFVQPELLLRLLGQMGVPAEKRGMLLDTLYDYTDTDNLRRLNGAEADEYRKLGLPPPPNDWLTTPNQLQHIIGWREQAAFWQSRRLLEIITAARVTGFNPNTAPREMLAALSGVSPEMADKLVEMRTLAPFVSESQLTAVVGRTVIDSEQLSFFPGNSARLTLESKHLPWALQYQITLTPLADSGPWRIDYAMRTVVTSSPQNAKQPSPLPPRASLPASANEAL